MIDAIQTIHRRVSANSFEQGRSLPREAIADLVADSQHSPSSFNIQHTRFVAVTDPAIRQELQAAAYGQRKVTESSATLLVLGDLDAHRDLARTLQPSVDANIIDPATMDTWVQMAGNFYNDNPQFRRDEAFRSASLSAMTLMIAAEAKGYSTGPMIGFNPGEVTRILRIPDRYAIVMMIVVGFGNAGNWPRKPRLPIDRVIAFDSADGLLE